PADVSREVAGVPDEARLIHDQVVRAAAGRQIVALELTSRRDEVREIVARLPAKPDPSRRRIDIGIARASVRPGHRPFFDDGGLVDNGGKGGNGGNGEKQNFHESLPPYHSPVSILLCSAVKRLRTEPSKMRSPT